MSDVLSPVLSNNFSPIVFAGYKKLANLKPYSKLSPNLQSEF